MTEKEIKNRMRVIRKEYENEGLSFMDSSEYKILLQKLNKLKRADIEQENALYRLRDKYKKEIINSKKKDKATLNELFSQVKKEMEEDKK